MSATRGKEDFVTQLVDACHILPHNDLTELFTGHVSYRMADDVLIPEERHEHGLGLDSVDGDNIIAVDLAGEPTTGVEAEPPGEYTIHSSIYCQRTDIRSVAHAHPPYATGISAANRSVSLATVGSRLFESGVPLHDPGPTLIQDEEEGRALARTMGDAKQVLIRGHGVVTAGESIAEAVARLYLLERTARIHVIASNVDEPVPFEEYETGAGYLDEASDGFHERVFKFLRDQLPD